jgi:hypothetical protein
MSEESLFLEPCVFCGAAVEVKEIINGWRIECLNRKCKVQPVIYAHEQMSVVNLWNTWHLVSHMDMRYRAVED